MRPPMSRRSPSATPGDHTRSRHSSRFVHGDAITLEVGNRADIVVLECDLFTISPEEIGEVRALLDGEVVVLP